MNAGPCANALSPPLSREFLNWNGQHLVKRIVSRGHRDLDQRKPCFCGDMPPQFNQGHRNRTLAIRMEEQSISPGDQCFYLKNCLSCLRYRRFPFFRYLIPSVSLSVHMRTAKPDTIRQTQGSY